MPISNQPDPNYEPENEVFDDGTYTVKGIKWVSTGEDGSPIFKVRAKSASLYSVYRSVLENGEDGPPGGASPAEAALLVRAFGGKIDDLPDRETRPTAFLMEVADRVSKSGKTLKVKVSGGWIQEVPGASLPVDKYFQFKLLRITTTDDAGVPSTRPAQYGPWFMAELEVVGSAQGLKTVFDGATIITLVNYGLRASKSGEPEYETKKDGSWTSAAVNIDRFLRAFVPSAQELEFSNPSNVLPEIMEAYRKDPKLAMTQIKKDKKGRVSASSQMLAGVDPDSDPDIVKTKAPVEVEARDVEAEPKESNVIGQIYDSIAQKAGDGAFTSEGILSDLGKGWCKENLKPFLTKEGIPASFKRWKPEAQVLVLAFLRDVEDEDEF